VADGAEAVTEHAGGEDSLERTSRSGAEGAADGAAEVAGAAVMREFVANSPLARHLGIELAAIERDRARLRLPFAGAIVTVGDVVHGGAISALVDTAATAAAWATDDLPDSLRGSTVGLTVDFVAAARGADLEATARVVRRGGTLCFCDVEVADPGGQLVAKALVTYKLG
jgi:uncharacterized protein (TIGR00369 family)